MTVRHLPERLSPTYRNRVRNLSTRNRNQGVKHEPEFHTASWAPKATKMAPWTFAIMPVQTCFRRSGYVGRVGLEPTTEGL